MTRFDFNVLADLFVTPVTFTIAAVGVAATVLTGFDMIGSWGYLVGIGGILGSVGWGVSRLILNPNKVLEDSLQKQKERQREAKEEELDEFDQELTDNKDWEVRTAFREIRSIYSEFLRLYPTIMESLRDEMEQQFLELFDRSVSLLHKADGCLLTLREIQSDRLKKPYQQSRAAALQEVKKFTDEGTNYVVQLAEAATQKDVGAMVNLNHSLQSNLKIMKSVEDEMSGFMSSSVTE